MALFAAISKSNHARSMLAFEVEVPASRQRVPTHASLCPCRRGYAADERSMPSAAVVHPASKQRDLSNEQHLCDSPLSLVSVVTVQYGTQ